MKTDAPHAPRSEPTRTHAATQAPTRHPRDAADAPTDLFATLLSGLEATLPNPPADVPDGSNAGVTDAAGTEAERPEDSDPRAAFLALLQPWAPATAVAPAGATNAPTTQGHGESSGPRLATPAQSPEVQDQAALASREPAAEGAATDALTPDQPRQADTASDARPILAGETSARPDNAWSNGWGRSLAANRSAGLPSQTAQLQNQPLNATAAALQEALSETSAPRAWHMTQAGVPGSALTDTASPTTPWGQAVAEIATGLGSGQTGAHAGDQPGAGTPQGRVWLDTPGTALATDTPQAGEPDSFASSLGEALGDAYERLGTEISLWAGAQTKRASVRIELDRDQALDVDVRLEDGRAHLAFRTDDNQIRDQLRSQAQAALSELLARAGIGLESLSVGAQQAGTQDSSGAPPAPPTLRIRVSQDNDAEGVVPDRPRLAERGTGQRGLDVYA